MLLVSCIFVAYGGKTERQGEDGAPALLLDIVICQGILRMYEIIAATESGGNTPFPLIIDIPAAETFVSYGNQTVTGRSIAKVFESGRGDDFSCFAHHTHQTSL